MTENIVTVIRNPIKAAAMVNHNQYHTMLVQSEEILIFDQSIEVVKKITCLETEEELFVPEFLSLKDARNYIQGCVGISDGTTRKAKNLN